jgi:polysaccharide deacetylase 2 family uncharacterized protein YibQ
MRQIFTVLKKRHLFFVDSRTTADTLCRPSAELLQAALCRTGCVHRPHSDRDLCRKQLKLLVKRARRQGYAIGIAHPASGYTQGVEGNAAGTQRMRFILPMLPTVVAFQQG